MRIYYLYAILTGDRPKFLGEYMSLQSAQDTRDACASDGVDELDHFYIGYTDLTDAE